MSAFTVGQQVMFTAPSNVTIGEHGIAPGQMVRAVIAELEIGEDEYRVEFDSGRVLALEDELISVAQYPCSRCLEESDVDPNGNCRTCNH